MRRLVRSSPPPLLPLPLRTDGAKYIRTLKSKTFEIFDKKLVFTYIPETGIACMMRCGAVRCDAMCLRGDGTQKGKYSSGRVFL